VLLPQVSLTPERLLEVARRLLRDRPALAQMGERARALAVPDAAERLAQLILDAAKA
jgi:UDP-N-acetylglucosamine--N-acetylmuramyl-(pentapeptide) pyrophosphoryl-undecaprenol N-acetylglucosamine transferase